MSFQFPQPCPSVPQPKITCGPRITSRCFWKSLRGLGSASTQGLLCPTVQKPGSSKVIPRPTVRRFVCCCVLVLFFLRQGKVMTLLQGHQDEACTFCVSKHRKVSCLVKDILFGPDPSYSPGPGDNILGINLGPSRTFGLGQGFYAQGVLGSMRHQPSLCSPEFSLRFPQKPLRSRTHPSCTQ